MPPVPIVVPGPGQESVWSYPRPPALEPSADRLVVVCGGVTIADTSHGLRVLETSHPPVYYFPPGDVRHEHLQHSPRSSYCEWKGRAVYYDVRVGAHILPGAAWAYPEPTVPFGPLADHVAFYCAPMDACYVGDERATPQPGNFYGGWVTSRIVGPFKGIPGSSGW